MTNIAIFPIPDCVTFPGTIFPLHVFEPRYRKLIKHCVETDTPLAIAHTQKTVREAKKGQTVEEALSSNQATYKPYEVFSAGRCELAEELEDGRMLALVHLASRYRKVSEVQTLPFAIYECEKIEDAISEGSLETLAMLKEKLLARLVAVTADMKEVNEDLQSEEWVAKDPVAFSFEVFGMLRLDGALMQKILEMRSPIERLQFTLDLLNQ